MQNRRHFLNLLGLSGAAVALTNGCGVSARPAKVPKLPPFSVPLRIPPSAVPDARDAGTDYYRIRMAETEEEIYPGLQTKVLTYNGEFPGATIRAKRGRKVVLTPRNHTTKPTVVHLHGGHLPRKDDGHPTDLIQPGAGRDYIYPNTQLGSTLWYHDHAHHRSAEQVYRGLAGMYILEDEEEERELGLPEGEFDVPLMIRDAQFDAEGQLVFVLGGFAGRKTILVNGKPQPYHSVAARKYRLRLLNCSNDRTFQLRLDNGGLLHVIASDGGLLPAPGTVRDLTLSPGERVEVIVDFSDFPLGTSVALTNLMAEVEETRMVMRFDVERTTTDDSRIPPTLRPMPDLGDAAMERHVHMRVDLKTFKGLIDNKIFDHNRIDQRIKADSTEIWTISNTDTESMIAHNMHLHLSQFQVLDRDGGPVAPHETGLKDTVLVDPGSSVRIKVPFRDYTGTFVYHCHMLDHSALGMMAQMDIR